MDTLLQSFWQLESKLLGNSFDIWLLVFVRVLAFAATAPVLNRKDINIDIRVGLSMGLATLLFFVLPPGISAGVSSSNIGSFTLETVLNATVGLLLGFIANLIFEAISAAGGFITSQIGLQAANIMDPSTRQQSAILTPLFNLLTVVLFLDIGGMGWLIDGLQRSFTMFPLRLIGFDIIGQISYDYVLELSANVFSFGLMIAAPFFVMTILTDIMLGIVNRAAQQIPVFQLSFATKPAVGLFVFWLTLRPLVQIIRYYLEDYRLLF